MEGNREGFEGRRKSPGFFFYTFYKKGGAKEIWNTDKENKGWGEEKQTEEEVEGDIPEGKEMDGGWNRDSCGGWKGSPGEDVLGTPGGVPGSIEKRRILERSILKLISFYQVFLSPYLPGSCRFYPSCSEYAREAISRYGIWKGGWMALWRVLRCNPFNPGGYDPVR